MTACSGYQYVASPRYVPLNEKKGDLTANVHLSAVQLGYAFANRFSVFATGFRRVPSIEGGNPLPVDGKNHRYGSSREINAGFSYFRATENFVVEVVAGGGYGDMSFGNKYTDDKHQDEGYQFDMTADRRNLFIQPSIRFKFGNARLNKHFSLGAFTKFNNLRYYHIRGDLRATRFTENYDDGIEYFAARSEAELFFIEPGVQVKAGFRNFKAMAQLCPVINASGYSMRYQHLSVSLGLTMNLNVLRSSPDQ